MIDDAGSLWELIERRAAATPDASLAVDEDERTLTYGEYRDAAERAAAGLAELRHRRGHARCRGSSRPGSSRSCSSARSPGSARCRTRSSRSTASARSASSPSRPAPSCSIVPSEWQGFDFEAMARAIADGPAGARGAGRRPQAARGRPDRPAAAAARARRPRRRAGALGLLHVGHDRRPEGRAAHRPHDHGVGVRR